jgi:antitoxin VapB
MNRDSDQGSLEISGWKYILMVYIIYRRPKMKTARLFITGRSQAVRLPKEYRFQGKEVYIKKVGGGVLLIPFHAPWKMLGDSLSMFSDDFMENREQPQLAEREGLFE